MLPATIRAGSFLKLPKSCQQWELTFLLTVVFGATNILLNLGTDIPLASRVIEHQQDTVVFLNYQSSQSSFSKQPKSC